jgi:hypothetical protein
MTSDPTRPLPDWWNQAGPAGPPRPARRRRRKGPLISLFTLIVIVGLLVVGDFAARAYTENRMASQVQSSLGLSGKPTVTIQGFPFLTQLIARDFKTVNVTAANETVTATSVPSGTLDVASLNATLHGMHVHSLNSATIDQFTATALITFRALANAGGVPQGITLYGDGPDQVRATVSIGPFSESAIATVTQAGPDRINVHVTDFGGIPTSVLGSLADFTVGIGKLPAGVTIQSVSVTQQGVLITAAGQDTTLTK